jgi:hypothetical protein
MLPQRKPTYSIFFFSGCYTSSFLSSFVDNSNHVLLPLERAMVRYTNIQRPDLDSSLHHTNECQTKYHHTIVDCGLWMIFGLHFSICNLYHNNILMIMVDPFLRKMPCKWRVMVELRTVYNANGDPVYLKTRKPPHGLSLLTTKIFPTWTLHTSFRSDDVMPAR